MKKENISEKELDDLLNQLSGSAQSPKRKYSASESYPKLQKQIVARKGKRIPLYRYVAAASIAILCILSATYFMFSPGNTEIVTIATADQTKEISLPDGSQVTLSRYSSLQYPVEFGSKDRDVILSGEAYFEVAKDQEHPFVVHADDARIKVLGTHFNVQSYPLDAIIKTTLLEGKVSVGSVHNDEVTILDPNESAFFVKESQSIYKEKDPDAINETAWIQGKHLFNNKPLSDITRDLENYFNVQIDINNTALKQYKLTANFEQGESLEEILDVLQIAANFRWIKNNDTIKIMSDN